MAENSKIEWTDHTFNPWTGCTKISPGCDHCYAEGWAKRAGHPERWRREPITAAEVLAAERATGRRLAGRVPGEDDEEIAA